jgi:hypothetical protein
VEQQFCAPRAICDERNDTFRSLRFPLPFFMLKITRRFWLLLLLGVNGALNTGNAAKISAGISKRRQFHHRQKP